MHDATSQPVSLPPPLHTQYVAADLHELYAVQTQVETGNLPATASGKPRVTTPWRGLVGWLLFAILSVLLLLVVKRGWRLPPPVERLWSTDNWITTVLLGLLPSLLVGALILLVLGKRSTASRVPFYTAPAPPEDLSWLVCRIGGMLLAAAAVVAIVVIARTYQGPDWSPTFASLFLAGAFPSFILLLIVLTVLGRRTRSLSAHAPLRPGSSLLEPRTIAIETDGVRIRSTREETLYRWPAFVSYFESENLLLLYNRDLQAVILPKRSFTDEQHMRAFFAAIHTHIPVGQFRTAEARFPVVQTKPTAPPSTPLPPPLPTQSA